jgi:signal transduction histidine kinase
MARDVHDVVGHSLAVIIAQADSVGYVRDPDAVRAVVATIARTARSSLAEVRAVIGETNDSRIADPGDLDALLEPVRAAGVPLEHEVLGEPRRLQTEVAVVARRILQELLANALRHGAAEEPLAVRLVWRSEDLLLEVDNTVAEQAEPPGSGIEGMRTRLAGIGGHLDTGRTGDRFVALARLPYIPTRNRS